MLGVFGTGEMVEKLSKKVEDKLFTECDNSCAICGIRDQRALTVHHIEHAGKSVDNSYDNLIVLCHNCHTTYHQGKGLAKSDIQKVKRRLIAKTLTQFGLNALKEAKRKGQVFGSPYILNHLVEMHYLKFHESLMGAGADQIVTGEYLITPKGESLLSKWKL
jgi:hypothetical protein